MITLSLLAGLALAADEAPLVEALTEQMQRNVTELSLPEAPEVYHLRYQLILLDQVDATARFGAPLSSNADPYNALGVEMRIGDYNFDNTGFGGWENGFTTIGLPLEPTPYTVSLEAWAATDMAYKQAVEQYARKQAQFTPPADYPGDYTPMEPQVVDHGAAQAANGEPLIERCTLLSAPFVHEAGFEVGQVNLGHEAGVVWTLDSDGSRVRRPMEETTIRASAHLRTEDGMLLTDHRLWSVGAANLLPPPAEMVREVETLTAELAALAETEALADEYVGPVLFDDTAAVDLMRYLLVPQLEGTPAPIPFDSWFGELGQSKDPIRLGRRVLPEGWQVIDDPQLHPNKPGSFVVDWEGTPAERVDLVQDGIIQNVLMSRVPRKGVDAGNGHARGFVNFGRAQGRAAQMQITPAKALSDKAVHKRAMKVANAYGRDWYLVVRRLQEPAVLGLGDGGGAFFSMSEDNQTALPAPVAVYKRFADGTEVPLRGAAFSNVERWALRDILAAGAQQHAVFLAPMDGDYSFVGATEGLQTWIEAPSVLVGELEVVPSPGDPKKVPALPKLTP